MDWTACAGYEAGWYGSPGVIKKPARLYSESDQNVLKLKIERENVFVQVATEGMRLGRFASVVWAGI